MGDTTCSDLDCDDPACAEEPACAEVDDDTDGDVEDRDGDGYPSDEDCDDDDPTVHEGADEVCDGLDNDCDGSVDEDAIDMGTWYADADGDGYGDGEDALERCDQPSGRVADDTDCDDTDPAVNPGATEQCDGVDNDCSGSVDELDECTCDPSETWLVNGNAETGDLTGWTGNSTGSVTAAQSAQESDGEQVDVQTTSTLTTPSLTWVPFDVKMEAPEGATTWEVELTGTLVYGSYVNVFFDAVTLGCEE